MSSCVIGIISCTSSISGNAAHSEARDPKHVPGPNVAALAALTHRMRGLAASDKKAEAGEGRGDFSDTDLLAIQQLTDDASGLPVLWTSGNNYWWQGVESSRSPTVAGFASPCMATTTRILVSQVIPSRPLWINFGARHAFYRRTKSYGSEGSLILNPADQLSDDLLLAIALSSIMLDRYRP